jgi:hypothetical protein
LAGRVTWTARQPALEPPARVIVRMTSATPTLRGGARPRGLVLLALALLAALAGAPAARAEPMAAPGSPLVAGVSGEALTAEPAIAEGKPPAAAGGEGEEAQVTVLPEPGAAIADAGAATTSCSPAWGTFRIGNWPSGCWHPFGSTSPFNFVIPASPKLSSESSAIVTYMVHHRWAFEHNEAGNFTWDDNGSRPLYWPTSTDPVVTVMCTGSNCQTGMKPRIPVGAQPEEGSDAHMTVVDQEHGKEYDFWQASKPENGKMTARAGKSIPIGAESGTGLEGNAEAADLGLLGGIVRASELSAGKIEHALVTTVKCVQLHDVWPSPSSATGDSVCLNERPGPHFASLLQLNMTDAEIAATKAPGWQQTIMKAMAHYGVYVVDTMRGSQMYLLTEDDKSFTSFGYTGQMAAFVKSQGGANHLLTGVPIPTAKLRVIDPCVPQKTC